MAFIPKNKQRIQQNFFYEFFPDQESFVMFLRENILDSDENFQEQFLVAFYRTFLREYRNVIVLEQEWFYDDFITVFIDNKRKFEILYQLWKEPNNMNPFSMINDIRYEHRNHKRNNWGLENDKLDTTSNQNRSDRIKQSDDLTANVNENRSDNIKQSDETMSNNTETRTGSILQDDLSKTMSKQDYDDLIKQDNLNKTKTTGTVTGNETNEGTIKNTDLNKENAGQIQGTLLLSDMDVEAIATQDVATPTTSASVNKNKRTDENTRETTNKTDEMIDNEALLNTNRNSTTTNDTQNEAKSQTQEQQKAMNDGSVSRENTTEGSYNTLNDTRSNRATDTSGMYETKNDANSQRSRNNQSETVGNDDAKWYNENRADLIAKFNSKRLREGFLDFVKQKEFTNLFGRMNAGFFSWFGYWNTDYDNIPMEEINDEPEMLETIIKEKNIGYIDESNPQQIANGVVMKNPQAKLNDFFVSNIYPNEAWIIGTGDYQGYVKIEYLLKN